MLCVLNLFSYCLDKVTFTEYVPWVCDECNENEITRTTNFDVVPPVTDLVEHSHVVDDPIWSIRLTELLLTSPTKQVKVFLNKQSYFNFIFTLKWFQDDLWPKYFNTPEATVDDIELFFFPSEARHQDKFDSMVQDMIGGEHALRALTPYGELLVFTSTELPLRHWRYQQKCYLWGIFRATQGSSSRLLVPNRNRTPDNILAARDAVNHRSLTEDDAQVMTNELGRGKRIRKAIARLDDYI
ncbi:hypothetical protein KY290_020568 [Solanum tuberosum]|uniref:AIPP2-like SPOC-like domain-containing protein n=1 Tax=Solanum tuberosum TaxID=4113 RepID=A0ABQ7V240_SOLTU|nr:hypothetical protein KY290_020568 [Solanum tuberosum]